MIGGQQQRPIEEQQMSQWERNALDQRRWEAQGRRAKEPELFAQLDRIEAMLKELLSR